MLIWLLINYYRLSKDMTLFIAGCLQLIMFCGGQALLLEDEIPLRYSTLLWSCNWIVVDVKLAFRKPFFCNCLADNLITPWGMEVTWNVIKQQYCRQLCFKCCLGCHLEFICSFIKPLYCFCFPRHYKTLSHGNSSIVLVGDIEACSSACLLHALLAMQWACSAVVWTEKSMLALWMLLNWWNAIDLKST